MIIQKLQRLLLILTLTISVMVILLATLPGDLSPLGILQNIANAFARDGSFGGLDLAFYQKLQRFMLPAGLVLLVVSAIFAFAFRQGRAKLVQIFSIVLGGGYFLGVLVAGNLAIGRSDSLVYRQVFGEVTPVPSPTPFIYPTAVPTPITFGTGQWQLIVDDITTPTAIVDPGDGSGRLFFLEETGLIRVMLNDQLLPEPFMDLRDRTLQTPENYEQGLLGLAFHPNFAENGYFFVFYTDYQENSVISRFRVTADGQRGDPNSEFRLLGILKPGPRHYGGTLVFGPDGYLYISIGDGDLRQKTLGHAQSLDELFGKILRLDVDQGNPYGIPPDNPFVNEYGRDEIYLYGLRNPWKISFDSVTGDLYIGDVGQNDWEEINFLAAGEPAGLNYGWDVMEGPEDFSGYRGAPVHNPDFVAPIFYYHHKPIGCSVTGGLVYYGQDFPELNGSYLFGDFCSGYIWGLKQNPSGEWETTILYDTDIQLTTFGVNADGEVYAGDLRGMIYKLVP